MLNLDQRPDRIERAVVVLTLLLVALTVSGTEACQESYDFASQANVTASASATVTASETESPTPTESDDETTVPTGSQTPDDGDDGDDTPTPTTSPTASTTATVKPSETAGTLERSLLQSLGSLKNAAPMQLPALSNSTAKLSGEGNWLGRIYGDEEISGASLDRDDDGYSDLLENDFGTDPTSPNSFPNSSVTQLASRLLGFDDDADGLSNRDELTLGTNPKEADSDGDSALDGAEVNSESDPLDKKSRPSDSDGDGLSDNFEASTGIDFRSADTDGDKLRDDLELALGSNPLSNDSDRDGILDWKEVQLGTDPTIAEAGR